MSNTLKFEQLIKREVNNNVIRYHPIFKAFKFQTNASRQGWYFIWQAGKSILMKSSIFVYLDAYDSTKCIVLMLIIALLKKMVIVPAKRISN